MYTNRRSFESSIAVFSIFFFDVHGDLDVFSLVLCVGKFRFRRERHTADVEKGDGKEDSKESGSQIRKVSSSNEDTGSGRARPSKWGRLLG